MDHRLRLVDDRDALAGIRDVAPVVREVGDILWLEPAQGRLSGVNLPRVVVLGRSPGGDSGRQLRPDRARKRLEGVAEPCDRPLLRQPRERGRLTGRSPLFEEGCLGSIQPDDEYLG